MSETISREDTVQVPIKYPAIFEMGLKTLIYSKSNALIQLRAEELELIKAKHELADKERMIILSTDFKELGLTNEKMRNAYVNEKLSEDKLTLDVKKHSIECKKDDIEIINSLIKFNELELAGE